MSFIFTGAAHSVCAELSFTLENCTRFILCSLLSDFIVQRRIEFPGRWIAIEISHPDDKWPSFPRTSSGFKINVFSLRALLRVLLEISLTTEVKQTSPLTCCLIFQVIDTWEAPLSSSAWAPARVEGPLFSWSCRNLASSGAAQQSGAVVEETIPLSKAFPWEYWVTVWESSTVVFDSASRGRLPPHLCAKWTAVTRTTRMWTVRCCSIHLKCEYEWYDT